MDQQKLDYGELDYGEDRTFFDPQFCGPMWTDEDQVRPIFNSVVNRPSTFGPHNCPLKPLPDGPYTLHWTPPKCFADGRFTVRGMLLL